MGLKTEPVPEDESEKPIAELNPKLLSERGEPYVDQGMLFNRGDCFEKTRRRAHLHRGKRCGEVIRGNKMKRRA